MADIVNHAVPCDTVNFENRETIDDNQKTDPFSNQKYKLSPIDLKMIASNNKNEKVSVNESYMSNDRNYNVSEKSKINIESFDEDFEIINHIFETKPQVIERWLKERASHEIINKFHEVINSGSEKKLSSVPPDVFQQWLSASPNQFKVISFVNSNYHNLITT